MDKQTIRLQLKQINLNVDLHTIDKVEYFLMEKIGFISDIEPEYQIYAGAAIVSQIQTLPTIGLKYQTSNGIKIQNVMSHLGNLSKERFLDTLNKQLQKTKQAPQKLKKRIQDIRFSYRFYKKYQTTFEQIYNQILPKAKDNKQQFSALFWVMYLYVKNTYIETQNIGEAKTLLILLFRAIFQKFIANVSFDQIFDIMQKNIGSISQISEQKQNFYYQSIQNKIDYFYRLRHPENNTNFTKLANSYTYLDRLVDDASNAYVKEQNGLRFFNQIDELSYLQLKKNLTPQVFRKMQVETVPIISKAICFDSDMQEDEQPEQIMQTPHKIIVINSEQDKIPTPVTEFTDILVSPGTPKWANKDKIAKRSCDSLFYDSALVTPVSIKQSNQKWRRRRIELVTPVQFSKFKDIFESIFPGKYQSFEMETKQKILKLIQEFTPKCQDYECLYSQIYAFFVGYCLEIERQSSLLFKSNNIELLNSIACLAFQIFDFTNISVKSEYKRRCEVFENQVLMNLKALDLFVEFTLKNTSQSLQSYLKRITKLYLVSQVWQNSQGYKIICESQNNLNPKFSNFKQAYKMIISQSESRIRQICRPVRIQTKIIAKTINMINFIFQNKPYLLKSNNLDQIILCSLMSCLSMNQREGNKTLQLLFDQYNSVIEFSYNQNQHGLKDNEGNSMIIVDYYNQVFLNQIQDMLNVKFDNLEDFLLTPVRISEKYSTLQPQLSNFPLRKQINPQKSFPSVFSRDRSIQERKNSRLMSLMNQNSEMKQQKQEDEQDIPSPSFGRNFSFGPASSQK